MNPLYGKTQKSNIFSIFFYKYSRINAKIKNKQKKIRHFSHKPIHN